MFLVACFFTIHELFMRDRGITGTMDSAYFFAKFSEAWYTICYTVSGKEFAHNADRTVTGLYGT